ALAPQKTPPKPAETPPKAAPAPAKPAPAPAASTEATTVVVKRGDTLASVARTYLEPGVSLDQMLVSLYRDNPEAFVGKNMNRLKTGAVLKITPAEKAEVLPSKEAQQVIRAQTADWNAYRRKLATAAGNLPVSDSTGRAAGGTVETPVANVPEPASSGDQVKVSGGAQKGSGGKAQQDEALLSRDKALKESQDRVKELEQNVADLQNLLTMTQQRMAALEQQVKQQNQPAAAPVPPQEAPAASETPAVEPPKPETSATPPEAAEPPREEAPAEVAPPPAEAAEPEPAPPKEEPKAAPKPPKKPMPVVEPEPVEEPSLLDDLPLLPIGGLIVVLALGGLWYYRKKKAAAALEDDAAIDLAALAEEVQKDSEANPPAPLPAAIPAATSPSTPPVAPAAPESSAPFGSGMETSTTDAVAAAQLMLSKGQDQEAEEILLDALQKEDRRLSIYSMLLGIYAKRGSAKQFETLASELYALTGGMGEEWAMAEEMGRQLGLDNPLFAEAPLTSTAPEAPLVDNALEFSLPETPVAPADIDAARQAKEDQELASFLSAQQEDTPAAPPAFSFEGLDLNLGDAAPAAPAAPAAAAPAATPAAEPDEVETKLELALAYEDMGDLEGASDLLNEVVSDGTPAQIDKAKAALARIAAASGGAAT
ncbi:MAG: hypothetical protein LBL69_05150, partial [Zoogloeaceae bacterium]|nr:hypothetical protein [Zoogloeaceae bacterium]